MGKRMIAIFVLILCICVLFSGCNLTVLPAAELIRPPKLSGESSFLQQAFEKTVTGDFIQMKTPINGENRSSYVIFDIDSDGYDDGLVFYSDPSQDDFARVAVFKHDGNEWKNISNLEGIAEEIYEVGFNDLNGDGKYEILISWMTLNPDSAANETLSLVGNRTLTLYKFGSNGLTLLKTERFTKMYVSDLNGDKSDDIFLSTVNISDGSYKTTGRILLFNNDCSVKFDETFPLMGMIDVVSIVSDTVKSDGDTYTRIFVDGALSEAVFATDVINFMPKDNSVSAIFHDDVNSEIPITARSSKVFSCDIDGDGIIEIPTLWELPYSKVIYGSEISYASALNLVVWSCVNDGELEVDFKTLYNKANNYYFVFEDEWLSSVTAVYNANTSLLVFYTVENGEIGDKIFSVKTFAGTEWDDNAYGFDLLFSTDEVIYGYKYVPNEYITKQQIKKNFVVIH